MKIAFQNFKWKRAVVVCILCTMVFLFINSREIRIKKELSASAYVSVGFMDISVYEILLTDDFYLEEGSAVFESLMECLKQYRYYEKLFPRKGFKERVEKISLTFWDEKICETTCLAIYSDGTVYVDYKEVRCVQGLSAGCGKELFLELCDILEHIP